MARLRSRIAASGWAGGEWARAGWVDILFSARMDGIGPLFVAAEFWKAPRVNLSTDIVGHTATGPGRR